MFLLGHVLLFYCVGIDLSAGGGGKILHYVYKYVEGAGEGANVFLNFRSRYPRSPV